MAHPHRCRHCHCCRCRCCCCCGAAASFSASPCPSSSSSPCLHGGCAPWEAFASHCPCLVPLAAAATAGPRGAKAAGDSRRGGPSASMKLFTIDSILSCTVGAEGGSSSRPKVVARCRVSLQAGVCLLGMGKPITLQTPQVRALGRPPAQQAPHVLSAFFLQSPLRSPMFFSDYNQYFKSRANIQTTVQLCPLEVLLSAGVVPCPSPTLALVSTVSAYLSMILHTELCCDTGPRPNSHYDPDCRPSRRSGLPARCPRRRNRRRAPHLAQTPCTHPQDRW